VDLELGLDHAVAGLQLEVRGRSAAARARDADLGPVATTAATASAAAPAAGDSDLPGWQRNPGDRDVSGSSASTTASAAGA